MSNTNAIDLTTVLPLARLGRAAISRGIIEGEAAILRGWGVPALWGAYPPAMKAVGYAALCGYRAAIRGTDLDRARVLAISVAGEEGGKAFDFAVADYGNAESGS